MQAGSSASARASPSSSDVTGMDEPSLVAQVACANKMGRRQHLNRCLGSGQAALAIEVARASVAAGPFCGPSIVDAWRQSRLREGPSMPITSELAPIQTAQTVCGHSFDADFELT